MDDASIVKHNEPVLILLDTKRSWARAQPSRRVWVCKASQARELDTITGKVNVLEGDYVVEVDGLLWVCGAGKDQENNLYLYFTTSLQSIQSNLTNSLIISKIANPTLILLKNSN